MDPKKAQVCKPEECFEFEDWLFLVIASWEE